MGLHIGGTQVDGGPLPYNTPAGGPLDGNWKLMQTVMTDRTDAVGTIHMFIDVGDGTLADPKCVLVDDVLLTYEP